MSVQCFLRSYLQPAVGTIVIPWNVVALYPQASRLAKIPVGTLLSSAWSVRCGSVRDQAGGGKCILQLKTPIFCHNLGNVLAKGQRKQCSAQWPLHGSLERLQPHTFVRYRTDFKFVSVNTSFSLALPSSAQLIATGISSRLYLSWHHNHSLHEHLREGMAMSVNKVRGSSREHRAPLAQCCRDGLTHYHLSSMNEARVAPLGRHGTTDHWRKQ